MKKFMMILMAVALMALPAMAQPKEQWQSTSAMQTSGSNYAPQVNAIGAESANQMATTTTTNTYNPGGPHRAKMDDDDWGTNPHVGEGDEGSPIGDAMLPLMLCAVVFGGAIAFRRRREA